MTCTEALNSLFRHEIEFHRLARTAGISQHEREQQHGQHAISQHDEPLIRACEGVTYSSVGEHMQRLLSVGDSRDVLAARDSLLKLLKLSAVGNGEG